MRTIFILLIILISSTLYTQGKYSKVGKIRERPRILIKYIRPIDEKMEGSEELNNLRNSFEGSVAQQISEEFPCAIINTYTEVQAKIAYDRQWNDGINGSYSLQDALALLDCDILISLTSYKLGGKYYFVSCTMDPRSATVAGRNESGGKNSSIDYSELIRQIIRDLVEMELCPYKGDVTFSSVKTFKDSQERNGLPNQDCEFKATKEEDNKTVETWTFQKAKRFEGIASVNYTINNYKKETERNTCAHCSKMENGYRLDVFEANRADMKTSSVITETYSATNTAPLSSDVEYEKYNALIKIFFDTKANNYTITVKAVSQPAKWTKKTAIRNSGCPYDEDFDNEVGATYGQRCERTFGPFPGSPYQKNLKQNVTKTYTDEGSDGKGKTVETISFNLSR
jgi:hypothetical protein